MSIAGIYEHAPVVGQDSIKITVVRAACYSYGCPCGGQDYKKKKTNPSSVRGFRRAVAVPVLVSSARTGQPHGRGFPRAPPARVSAPAPNQGRPSVRRAPQGTTASQTGQSPLASPRAPATEVGKGKTRRKPDWRKPRVPLFFSVLARSLESRTDRWMGSLLALGRKYSCGAHPPNPSRTAIRRRSC